MRPFQFPEHFLFGSATAGVQVEGGDRNNNWYVWAEQGHIKDGSDILRAGDHWNRYREDIALLAQMHHKVYRMGIEWSRIEPEKGRFDEQAIAHYRDVLSRLIQNHVRPLVTLHHFTYPIWLDKEGGFASRQIVSHFKRYTAFVVERLGDLVSEYITINEPNVFLLNGYVAGLWPPGKKDLPLAYKVFVNMSHCHMAAYELIHKIRRQRGFAGKTMVGVANHLRVFDPLRKGHTPDSFIAEKQQFFFQDAFADYMTTGTLPFPARLFVPQGHEGHYADFIGINYYSRNIVNAVDLKTFVQPDRPVNDLGWEIYPDGLRILCETFYERYHLPIWITENGVCDNNDVLRVRFIAGHLQAVKRAIDKGVPVDRYYHWSLMDNFEWLEGETARFGLVYVDYETQRRIIKKSGRFYAKICESGGLTEKLIREYGLS